MASEVPSPSATGDRMATVAELYNQAVRCHQSGNLRQAEPLYRQVLAADPAHAAAHQMLGLLAYQAGHAQPGIALLRQAVALDPRNADCHFNLGLVFMQEADYVQAIDCFRRAHEINPQHANAQKQLADAYSHRGIELWNKGQFAEGVECCRQSLTIDSNNADAHHNLSITYTLMGQLPEALAHNEQATRIDPGHRPALFQRTMFRLLQGDLIGGWQEYEQRRFLTTRPPRLFDQPRWNGSSLAGKTILVHADQGLGSTIQFVRFLVLLQERGAAVLLECQSPLLRLLAGIPGAKQIFPHGASLPPFDMHAPLVSLPGILGTTLETIPANIPYLHAEAELAAYWRKELGPDGFKVAIAWQGSASHPDDRYRSISLAQFEPLARVPGVELVSLQKGPGSEQIKECAGRFPIRDLGDRLDATGAFRDTAAILTTVDLVVTVDSAIAHLAGALGVPVWLVLSVTPDWRWLLNRTDSPWYPTMRLFRQSRFGDWDDVFERMAAALRAKVGEPSLKR
jgi:tetratricopeptide (TPR) repeat protein